MINYVSPSDLDKDFRIAPEHKRKIYLFSESNANIFPSWGLIG